MQMGNKRIAYAPAGEGLIDFRNVLKKLNLSKLVTAIICQSNLWIEVNK
jgi:hypothetical protein